MWQQRVVMGGGGKGVRLRSLLLYGHSSVGVGEHNRDVRPDGHREL